METFSDISSHTVLGQVCPNLLLLLLSIVVVLVVIVVAVVVEAVENHHQQLYAVYSLDATPNIFSHF